jgi:hypothetical protein
MAELRQDKNEAEFTITTNTSHIRTHLLLNSFFSSIIKAMLVILHIFTFVDHILNAVNH